VWGLFVWGVVGGCGGKKTKLARRRKHSMGTRHEKESQVGNTNMLPNRLSQSYKEARATRTPTPPPSIKAPPTNGTTYTPHTPSLPENPPLSHNKRTRTTDFENDEPSHDKLDAPSTNTGESLDPSGNPPPHPPQPPQYLPPPHTKPTHRTPTYWRKTPL